MHSRKHRTAYNSVSRESAGFAPPSVPVRETDRSERCAPLAFSAHLPPAVPWPLLPVPVERSEIAPPSPENRRRKCGPPPHGPVPCTLPCALRLPASLFRRNNLLVTGKQARVRPPDTPPKPSRTRFSPDKNSPLRLPAGRSPVPGRTAADPLSLSSAR